MINKEYPLVGQSIGHIRILGVLGRGGMGAVYQGFDDALQRKVAIKVIRSEFRFHDEAKARFLREARILSQVDHPNICRVYDYIEGEDSDYLVLELVEGGSLHKLRKTGFSETQCFETAEALLDVLAAVHERGVIHRDLKPDNVMISTIGGIKVLDFGLARSEEEFDPILEHSPTVAIAALPSVEGSDAAETFAGETIGIGEPSPPPQEPVTRAVSTRSANSHLQTMVGAVLGTAEYMSPEQARGEMATAASDIYSLGLILQELFTNQYALDHSLGRIELISIVSKGESRPVEGLAPDLTSFINRLKSVEPGSRPSAIDAAERLRFIRNAPKRRKKHLILTGAWILIALVAIIMGIQTYRLSLMGQREKLASLFGQEAQKVESLMRYAHLSPLHDLEPDKQRVRERINWITEHINDVGDWGRGPGLYAIGRGHLSLGDAQTAREFLQQSWDHGYQQPEVANALGLALGALYQHELERIMAIRDLERRQIELEDVEKRLRDPALQNLQQGVSGKPEYIGGLIALYEKRFDDALAAAEILENEAPWFFESELLEGDTLFAMALDRAPNVATQETLQELERAANAYSRAGKIGQSDPRASIGQCQVWGMVMSFQLYDSGGDLGPALSSAISSCDQALIADPNNPETMLLKGSRYRMQAESLLRQDLDPGEALEAARTSALNALAIDADYARAHDLVGITLMFDAAIAIRNGQGGRREAEAAISSFERAINSAPNDSGMHLDLGNGYMWLATAIQAAGENPLQSLEKAGVAFSGAAELRPETPEPWNNRANIEIMQADYKREHNGDPLPHITRAITDCQKALELKPTHTYSVANMGIAYLIKGQYLRTEGEDPRPSLAEARKSLEHAIKLNPDLLTNYLYLAQEAYERAAFISDEGEDPTTAIGDCRKAIKEALRRAPQWHPVIEVQEDLRKLTAG